MIYPNFSIASGNLLLTDVYERYYVDLEYGEEYRGVYLIRGENVVLVGELVSSKGKGISDILTPIPVT